VANSAALDFETSPLFELTIGVTDNGTPVLSAAATVSVELADVAEPIAPGIYLLDGNLQVQGTTGHDTIYLWTDAHGRAFAWMNGVQSGPHVLVFDGRTVVHAGEGNDRVFATDSARSVSIYGEGGHDLIVGSRADDLIDGGDGYDRVLGMQGDDLLLGSAGGDYLDGGEGNDVLVGGDGNDRLVGSVGRDVLLGGRDSDRLDGGDGEDLLIGGSTDFDASHAALLAILGEWTSPASLAARATNLLTGAHGLPRLALGETVHDDETLDCLLGGHSHDWYFAMLGDALYQVDANDHVTA
jgi:Ca2+-binding RTX toxin-like protein